MKLMHIKTVLVLATTASTCLATAAYDESTNTASLRGKNKPAANNIVSFPIIPHHEVLNRRRRELNVDDSWMPDNGEYRRRVSDDESGETHHQQLGALYQGYGTHYADVWVGKPIPQRQTVIVDTGSSVTAFPCSGCTDCGESYHTDSYFLTENSGTYEVTDCSKTGCQLGYCEEPMGEQNHKVCSVHMSYAEGSSWTAVEATDYVYAGGPHDGALVHDDSDTELDVDDEHIGDEPGDAYVFEFKLTFGCQHRITGLFVSQLADGIMGMELDQNAFWKQMYDANIIHERRFSLCYSRQPTASREGTEAGAMTLGGVDTRLHKSPMVYAADVHSTGFYTVYVKAIYIRSNGGESALKDSDDQVTESIGASPSAINYGNIIVDSGTTDTYLASNLHQQFVTLWDKMAGRPYTNSPIDLTHAELLALPTVLFQLEAHTDSIDEGLDVETTAGLAGALDAENPRDIILAVPASHYMEYDARTGSYTARIYLSERSGGVIGANSMMGHDILFDDEQSRIGFAESDCDYMSIIQGEEAPSRN